MFEIPAAVAEMLRNSPWAKEVTVDTSALSSSETFDLATRVIEECDQAGIPLKGVRVDPFVATVFPQGREFVNATVHRGAVIVLDPRLQDRIEVVRK